MKKRERLKALAAYASGIGWHVIAPKDVDVRSLWNALDPRDQKQIMKDEGVFALKQVTRSRS